MNREVENLRDDINIVVKNLHLSNEDFQLVRLSRYRQILISILRKFTNLKESQINSWWWNSFSEPTYYFQPENVFNALALLINAKENVWFIIEDDSEEKERDHYWLYEGKIQAIISVLKELPFTEYYVVSKKLEWILCENHHNLLIGCGDLITSKMKKVS